MANGTLRRLGKTDIEVSPVGLGVWQFSKHHGMAGAFWPALEDETAAAIVKASLAGGVNWFDTAEVYGGGESEKSLARALQAAGRSNGEAVVADKWWPVMRGAGSIRSTIDKRLEALGGYAIDLYQIHQPWSFSSVEAEMDAMTDLVEAGKIRAVGVSNFSAKKMRRAHAALERRGLPLASNQVRYSLIQRGIERNGVLEAARELGVTVIAWSPLEQGILTGKFHRHPDLLKNVGWMRKRMTGYGRRALERTLPVIEELERVAEAHGATPAQAALAWLVAFHGETVVAIPGATKVKQAEDNAAALNLELTSEELARLDEVSRRLA